MRIVQINSVPNLSTGAVMLQNHKRYVSQGHESWRLWGRGREAENEYEYKFGSDLGFKMDALQTRLFGKPGFHSKAATQQLLAKLDEIQPDLVHLHNIHGYYLNVEMLFNWLAAHNCQVEWTLHDCWSFTGHCSYFTLQGCDQWKTGCAATGTCPLIRDYPKTYANGSCAWSFAAKKRLFTMLPANRLKLITPSKWLADLTRESFLNKYPVEVRYNTVDTNVFKPRPSNFRETHGIQDKFMVLGVASPWSERKGFDDFLALAKDLDNKFAIVLVGLSEDQIQQLPTGVIGITRTDSREALAEIYATADVFFNPTKEDNYPTVNLEAEACGTPVVTYDVGGCPETIKMPASVAVAGYQPAFAAINALLTASETERQLID